MNLELTPRHTPGASVTPTGNGWRMEIPAGPRGRRYHLAQLDDYTALPRSRFRYAPPLTLSLYARASAPNLPGTWGFGLWNDPFGLSLGFGGNARRLPALPNTAWFFQASPENYLSLRGAQSLSRHDEATPSHEQGIASGQPAGCCAKNAPRNDPSTGLRQAQPGSSGQAIPPNGFFAGTFRSPRWPSLLLAPDLLALPLLALRPASRLLRQLASRVVRQDGAGIDIDVTKWHHYTINWLHAEVGFEIDGVSIFKTPLSPHAPLGLVLWIDNQYAAWKPDGSIGYGTLENPEARLEIENLELNA